MKYLDFDPIEEIQRNRELLLEKYGGMEGLLRHLKEIRPELIKEGWKVMSKEEMLALKE